MGLLMSGLLAGYGAEGVPDRSNVPRLDTAGLKVPRPLLERDEAMLEDLPGACGDDGIMGPSLSEG